MSFLGLKVIVVPFVPKGWRRSANAILLTADELYRAAHGDPDLLYEITSARFN